MRVNNEDIRCVFYEPQFDQKFALMVTKSSPAKMVEIDSIAEDIEPSEDLYFELMEDVAHSFLKCLK